MTLTQLIRRFLSDEACRRWIEQARWPDGPVCPRCGVMQRASRLSTRKQWTCLECRHRYSVTSRTPLHGTKLPLQVWMLAMYLIASSSKGISALKLSSLLGVGYKTAWHLAHRIRAMMATEIALLNGVVELDETYVGGKPRKVHRERALPREERPKRKMGRATDKACVFVSVARGGAVRTRIVPTHTAGALGDAVRAHVGLGAALLTDELPAYTGVGREYAMHLRVRHSGDEYVRGCKETGLSVHVNTAESFNATLKRAIVGVFHFVSAKHLHRYAAESAFRWNERGVLIDRMAAMVRVSPAPLPYRTLTA